jgi:hypothetical protein
MTRIASAAWGIGLSLMMAGEHTASRIWLGRAATLYRRSLADAEPGSWGRSIGALKSRLLAADYRRAEQEAVWTLQLGAKKASTIGRYAACLALLVLSRDTEARAVSRELERVDDFPRATAVALGALAQPNARQYETAIRDVLITFETRTRFLERIPVADTVLVLQRLGHARELTSNLSSPRLPTHAPQVR